MKNFKKVLLLVVGIMFICTGSAFGQAGSVFSGETLEEAKKIAIEHFSHQNDPEMGLMVILVTEKGKEAKIVYWSSECAQGFSDEKFKSGKAWEGSDGRVYIYNKHYKKFYVVVIK